MQVRRRHLRAGSEVEGVAAHIYLTVACLITRPRKSDADSGSIPLSLHPDASRIPFPSHTTASTGAGLGFSRPAWSLVPEEQPKLRGFP